MKTGSSSWFNTLWRLDHVGKPVVQKGFYKRMADKNKFKNVEQRSQVGRERGDSTFTRFMTTRHPLTRLYSGWNEHMRVIDGKANGRQWMKFRLWDKNEWGETHVCTVRLKTKLWIRIFFTFCGSDFYAEVKSGLRVDEFVLTQPIGIGCFIQTES